MEKFKKTVFAPLLAMILKPMKYIIYCLIIFAVGDAYEHGDLTQGILSVVICIAIGKGCGKLADYLVDAPKEAEAKREKDNKIEEKITKSYFCTNCGAQLEEGQKFCTECGKKVEE